MIKLSSADLTRTVQTIGRVLDLLGNHSIGDEFGWNTCFVRGLGNNIATDYADGKLRLGLGLETNFGTPDYIITPFGAVRFNEGMVVNQKGNAAFLADIGREFGAVCTNVSAITEIPLGGVDRQLVVLTKDGDQNPLGEFSGAPKVEGFSRFAISLAKDTSGLLKGESARQQIANVLDFPTLGLHTPHATGAHGNSEAALLQAVEKTGVSLSGSAVYRVRQYIAHHA